MVEHSTADREVPGSNPGVPSTFFILKIKLWIMKFLDHEISQVLGDYPEETESTQK